MQELTAQFIDGAAVNRLNYTTDLDVLLDSNFNFKQHIDYVVARGNQRLGLAIRKTKECLDPMCINTVHSSIVRSVLKYSCVV